MIRIAWNKYDIRQTDLQYTSTSAQTDLQYTLTCAQTDMYFWMGKFIYLGVLT
jgi:hypothetical protein